MAYNLLALRAPVTSIQEEIKWRTELVNGFTKERDRMHEMMKQYNFAAKNNPNELSAIQGTYNFEAQRVGQENAIIQKLREQMLIKHEVLYREYYARFKPLAKLASLTLVTARKELGIPLDTQKYLENINAGLEANEKAVMKLIDSLKPKNQQPSADADNI